MTNRSIADVSQKNELLDIVHQNSLLIEALRLAEQLELPNWYIGAGCVVQTVWNYFHHFPLTSFISDVDIVYFEGDDLSYAAEDRVIQQAQKLFATFPLPVDIKNQARVHLWYADHFGFEIPPHQSAESAIAGWPTVATCVALRPIGDSYQIYAPYGLDDLFDLVVRPNKKQVNQAVYEAKRDRWQKHWPKLTFIPW